MVFEFGAPKPDLTGWVKNLHDGSVEAIVVGPKESIEQLCGNVEEYFGVNFIYNTCRILFIN